MSEELKPCPFCGGSEIKFSGSQVGSQFECQACLTNGPFVHIDDWEIAAKAWNRRTESTALTAAQQSNEELKAALDMATQGKYSELMLSLADKSGKQLADGLAVCVLKGELEVAQQSIREMEGDAKWAERELLSILQIVGPGDGSDDDIIRMMKLTGIRRIMEADEEKYSALIDKHMDAMDSSSPAGAAAIASATEGG